MQSILLLLVFLFFIEQDKCQNLTDEFIINYTNETFLINDEQIELTTDNYFNLNFTNETNSEIIEHIETSPLVTRVLREVFRTYEPYCWRHSYGRGIGRPLNTCPEHSPEQDGFLCYPNCQDGYNGVGPVCWEKCENVTSFGFACIDLRKSLRSCPWYDKCGIFQRSCSSCPSNYTNFGCLCAYFHFRHSYGRGIGSPMTCSKPYEQDSGLCYEKCKIKYNGVGPVCWQYCPSTQPYPCLAGCSVTKEQCHLAVINMIQSVVGASVTLLNVIVGIPFVDITTFDILANAAKGDWGSVARDMTNLAKKLADKLLPDLAKKFLNWSLNTLQSATKNASVVITATAFKDQKSLMPLLQLFRLDSINAAFNHGKCDLPDDFDEIIY